MRIQTRMTKSGMKTTRMTTGRLLTILLLSPRLLVCRGADGLPALLPRLLVPAVVDHLPPGEMEDHLLRSTWVSGHRIRVIL